MMGMMGMMAMMAMMGMMGMMAMLVMMGMIPDPVRIGDPGPERRSRSWSGSAIPILARIGDPARIRDPARIGAPGEAQILEEWSNIDANWCNFDVFCGGRGLGTPIGRRTSAEVWGAGAPRGLARRAPDLRQNH